ncbi:thymidylate synthase [Gloeothece citriformis PCC 7424]|uniref:Thymidylate synthase n=1 Tax=Gloeothece citriformis (strain PCC 7424) TaxID=65393 RepID=B7KFY9_GLOC7|nr:thymidylate synthase [Gloeothece citriformis]ACK69182.1 thymidylate synthase [Gloeothece citriformis PCC 7424]
MTFVTGEHTTYYKPICKSNQLICGYGHIALITGWTVKQTLVKHLSPKEFAVIGNLYSPTRGITPLIRNLLANPHVRFVVILNATQEDKNAGACDCLLDFFRNGFQEGKSDTGRKCWLINSETKGYIDFEIDAKALDILRNSIRWEEVKTISEAVSRVKFFSQNKNVEAWGNPLEFKEVVTISHVLPGSRYGHRIEGQTIAETWIKILHKIRKTGTIRNTEYGEWQELIDIMAIVTDEPSDFYFPEPNYLSIERQNLQNYIEQMLSDLSSQEGVEYTYGKRLRSWFKQDQIEQVIKKLTLDINSSRAVMSLWDVHDHEGNDNPPCLNHIWLRVVENELSLTATFRSNDMFSAWPANAMGLRALQQHILDNINQRASYSLKMGPLITVSQSAHIYSDCWEYADRLIDEQYAKICQKRDFNDPSGSFVITLQNNTIIVEHTTPGTGEIVNCYTGKSARKLYQQIASNCPSLQVEHAMYLGTELQKAEIALSNSQTYLYIQDQPLSILTKAIKPVG